jgi:predicted kinase
MEMIIFIGIPASGKSSFYKERLFNSHLRVSLDLLRTRTREARLLRYCFDTSMPLVIDNTNVSVKTREKYIQLARENKFTVKGYYFRSDIKECMARNQQRVGKDKIPPVGIATKYKQLQLPKYEEGFDELFYVSMEEENTFAVQTWKENEVQ